MSVNITINTPVAESAGPVVSENRFLFDTRLSYKSWHFTMLSPENVWVWVIIREGVGAEGRKAAKQSRTVWCSWTSAEDRSHPSRLNVLWSQTFSLSLIKTAATGFVHILKVWECWFIPQLHVCAHTYSEGGALLDDGRQLRKADVHGQVPGLPAEKQHRDQRITSSSKTTRIK